MSFLHFGTELHFDDKCTNVGGELPPNMWRTVLAIPENSILLEVKEGPFLSSESKEPAPWVPEVGSKDAELPLADLQNYVKRH